MNAVNKCKILIITDTYVGQPGGSERHLFNFLSSVSGDFDVDVIQLNPAGNPCLPDGQLNGRHNVRLRSMPLQSIASFAALKVLLTAWAKAAFKRKSLVISYHEKADLLNFALSKMPFIKSRHVTSKRDMGFKLTGKLKKIMHVINKRFHAITAPSESIAEQMKAEYGVSQDKVFTVHNGVDLDVYRVSGPAAKRDMKKQLGLPADKKLLLSIGWLKPIKGYSYLLEAFAKLNTEFSDQYYLVILGEGPLLDDLQSHAALLQIENLVKFAGFQKNVQDWMVAADLLVSATLSEGLSNALVEGTASGLPIVATDVGGNPEVVESGFNGVLVPSENSQALADALLSLARDETRLGQMAINSRLKAERDFSNHNMVARLESIYQMLKAG